MLLFFAANGFFSLALTPAEEKARLEAELAQLEQQLAVISAGFGVNYSGLICDVSQIKYNNYNCDNLTGYHTVDIDDSDLMFDGNSVYYLLSTNENGDCKLVILKNDCSLIPDEVVNIKLRIGEINNQLKK